MQGNVRIYAICFDCYFDMEMYVQDLSKKIRSAMMTKKRQGKFIGDTAPFGYEKDPADKNHLIINEEHAATVRRIFKMAKDGLYAVPVLLRVIIMPSSENMYVTATNTYGTLPQCEVF